LVYSHHHADHAGAANLFDDVVRIGRAETSLIRLRDRPPAFDGFGACLPCVMSAGLPG
jgi:glyoxylase-like metal-dependent hydrolase (beta-lactamase superfamily II)